MRVDGRIGRDATNNHWRNSIDKQTLSKRIINTAKVFDSQSFSKHNLISGSKHLVRLTFDKLKSKKIKKVGIRRNARLTRRTALYLLLP